MPKIVQTILASNDVFEIAQYIVEQNAPAADRLLDKFDEALARLSDFPGLGQLRDDLAPGLRSYPVGSYLLFYRPIEGGIVLVRVIHGARNIRAMFHPERP